MEDIYAHLTAQISAAALAKSPGRLLVGISGPPGCGKSTIAAAVVRRLNEETSSSNGSCQAQTVPLDGFHYTRKYLDSLPLPHQEEAYIRRGAPWTFDVDGILSFIQDLAASARLPPAARPTILAPSFDHALKDPKQNDIKISADTSIVILDGNYLLLDADKWREIAPYLDLKIFVNVDPLLARERVASRHVAADIEPTLERGQKRFDTNDAINGDLIRNNIKVYRLHEVGELVGFQCSERRANVDNLTSGQRQPTGLLKANIPNITEFVRVSDQV
ncbi:hypothetical protein LTS03_003057 [Exophiala xenobiotica]|nr:hypothetical protein LTR92_000512 [Exophiala xenobiotica]KAK5211139.1 hypothetical protein LTR41_003751 [Exophiala xenobiotica]KAK5224538.1 hypothetical protein LTR72_004319 [Exophiala xenobiotica]KAK5281502.1 hypothetical protein LTR40_004751 [Exophiala xenobiotica]KAK5293621.1 hypothetical protein LTR14_004512 [Exophiala xenobiotica]